MSEAYRSYSIKLCITWPHTNNANVQRLLVHLTTTVSRLATSATAFFNSVWTQLALKTFSFISFLKNWRGPGIPSCALALKPRPKLSFANTILRRKAPITPRHRQGVTLPAAGWSYHILNPPCLSNPTSIVSDPSKLSPKLSATWSSC